ncbi:uncharacterized protein HD556DRAFT_1443462 [Suillus plorans]|uniref:Uncharacterized protein n=1 Tax=Suillus plorans TaxID=116603 RepID=A0A9P7APG1_9AGAM|nr:uncharacterized protein HD556DRAFT_1443462 [Suillus plorans]KAG1793674.1 hypothetical protein HD556DRAFT_1443462 [Suillus plorans]
MSNVDDAPSGKDKNEIHDIIAKLIFVTHPKYKTTYHQDLKKFRVSVANCITATALKNKYKKCKAKFSATGAGVVPLDATTSNNLLDEVNAELPWPGVDHAGNLYALIQLHGDPGRAGPSMNFEVATQASAQPSHSASSPQPQPHLPSHSASSAEPQPQGTFSPQPQPSNGSSNNDPPIDLCLLQAPPSFPHNDMDCNMHDPDDDDDDMDLSCPLSTPLGDALCHLEDDPMTLDSHARATGKKRQLAASPPPDIPSTFEVPQKSSTPFYDSHAAFSAQRPSSRGGHHRKTPSIASSGVSCSMSTPSSTTRNTVKTMHKG